VSFPPILTYCRRINDKGQHTVPQFSIQGEPSLPEVLSNKIILTQPSPGNARGAIWADNPNTHKEWVADVDFRVNGPERGGGNLNIWLARRGVQDVGTASIYKVGKFDGLALVIDRSGGGSGMIRGFLNDGTTDFSNHHSVDSLAFGNCDYSYRNLGRPSQIKLRQTQHSFRVDIDGSLCFETDKVNLPTGYNFGISAASAENPDSFEVFKLVVMTDDLNGQHKTQDEYPSQQQQQSYQAQDQVVINRGGHQPAHHTLPNDEEWIADEVPDASPDSITSSKAQFADLHNRIQSINHHLASIFRNVAVFTTASEARHTESKQVVDDVRLLLQKLDKLDAIQTQLNNMDREIKSVRGDMSNKIRDSENAIRKSLGDSHGTMLEHVATQASPKHGKLIFVIIGSQIMLVGAYIFYERKKTLPKKYL
jgi:mannose-binding lectin 1